MGTGLSADWAQYYICWDPLAYPASTMPNWHNDYERQLVWESRWLISWLTSTTCKATDTLTHLCNTDSKSYWHITKGCWWYRARNVALEECISETLLHQSQQNIHEVVAFSLATSFLSERGLYLKYICLWN